MLVVEKSVLAGSFNAIRLASPFKTASSPGRSGRDENSDAAERISSKARRLEVGVRERLKSSAIQNTLKTLATRSVLMDI